MWKFKRHYKQYLTCCLVLRFILRHKSYKLKVNVCTFAHGAFKFIVPYAAPASCCFSDWSHLLPRSPFVYLPFFCFFCWNFLKWLWMVAAAFSTSTGLSGGTEGAVHVPLHALEAECAKRSQASFTKTKTSNDWAYIHSSDISFHC